MHHNKRKIAKAPETKPFSEAHRVIADEFFAKVGNAANEMYHVLLRDAGLKVEDGWRVDAQGKRFVREAQPQVPPA